PSASTGRRSHRHRSRGWCFAQPPEARTSLPQCQALQLLLSCCSPIVRRQRKIARRATHQLSSVVPTRGKDCETCSAYNTDMKHDVAAWREKSTLRPEVPASVDVDRGT